ncbi:MAG TPA: CAP domain-containing protein [Mesorhizobium sp.]|jgi:uncharacterized protein YkwD|nr:CAP domain-containing protein [Mesorhizobium sp.]
MVQFSASALRHCARNLLAASAFAVLAGCAALPGLSGGSVSGAGVHSAEATSQLAAFRRAQGLGPLSRDRALDQAALTQARLMAGSSSMAHTTGIGRSFSARMRNVGVGTAAENIARGQDSVGEVLVTWENSPPHRRNMLDPRFEKFGLASATDGEGERYWALVLGK